MMIDISINGLIGGAIGATFGFIEYKAITHLMIGKMRMMDRSEPNTPERERFDQKIVFLERIMFIGTVVTTAMIGYAVGRLVK
jgi:hypothetical protein